MASSRAAVLCVLPAALSVMLSARCASLVSVAAHLEAGETKTSQPPNVLHDNLREDNAFEKEEAFLETQAVPDRIPFIRRAFDANKEKSDGMLLSKEEAARILKALQTVERLQRSQKFSLRDLAPMTGAEKRALARNKAVTNFRNASLVSKVLTKLASLATLKNEVGRKAAALIDSLHDREVLPSGKIVKHVGALLRKLARLQSRLMDLAEKFIKTLEKTIDVIAASWEDTGDERQKRKVLDFFKSLLKWAKAAKEASERRWKLIKALVASYVHPEEASGSNAPGGVKQAGNIALNAADDEAFSSVGIRGKLAAVAAATAYEDSAAGGVPPASSLRYVASLDSLFKEADDAQKRERDIAQSVWHEAAKCAEEGLLPLPIVRILLSES